ncbi:MAG: SAM-dependent methyltransferase [Ruminococcaceae bacterium]|nr:SAM-dependent methyltransferase [Oscillospiraceae bacterium]
MIKLDTRLKMAAEEVRQGKKVADIGTDHAYLPAYLIENNICPSAIAADIGKGPLENAKKVVSTSPLLSEKIQLRLSNGLEKISPDEADDIVIAGMGGILISEILTKAPWVKNENKRLILQPMSHAEDVRKYLCENGFEIIKEKASTDGKHNYIIIVAEFRNKENDKDEAFYYKGLIQYDTSEVAQKYHNGRMKSLIRKRDALKNAGHETDNLDKIING